METGFLSHTHTHNTHATRMQGATSQISAASFNAQQKGVIIVGSASHASPETQARAQGCSGPCAARRRAMAVMASRGIEPAAFCRRACAPAFEGMNSVLLRCTRTDAGLNMLSPPFPPCRQEFIALFQEPEFRSMGSSLKFLLVWGSCTATYACALRACGCGAGHAAMRKGPLCEGAPGARAASGRPAAADAPAPRAPRLTPGGGWHRARVSKAGAHNGGARGAEAGAAAMQTAPFTCWAGLQCSGCACEHPPPPLSLQWDTAAADIVVREAGGAVLSAGRCSNMGGLLEDWKVGRHQRPRWLLRGLGGIGARHCCRVWAAEGVRRRRRRWRLSSTLHFTCGEAG